MNKILLTALAISTIAVSCAPGKKGGSAGVYQNKMILGAFNDSVSTYSTLDLTKLKALPAVVDLSADLTPAKNQSDRGVCSIFSTMALVEAAIKKDLKKEVNLSEEYLNYRTKVDGYFSDQEGSNMIYNSASISNGGLMLERDWSYQPTWFNKGLPCEKYKNTDSSAPAYCYAHNAPTEKIKAKVIPANSGLTIRSMRKNTNEIISFLATSRRPLVVAVTVNFNGWPQNGDTYYNEELRAECLADSSHCGGHSVLLTGYDMNKKVFFFKNSWGKEWGNKGSGTITFDTVDKYVTEDLYYATANANLKIPVDYAVDKLALENFSSTAVLTGKSLDVSVKAKVVNASGRLIYISSFMAAKAKTVTEAASETNTQILQLDGVEAEQAGEKLVRALNFKLQTDIETLVATDANPIVLSIPQTTLNIGSVADLLSSKEDDAVMRTTIYVHTDDQSYKILKRVYQPIAQ